jgi:glycosyltransferase involved in cell wall biosynthesis
MKIWAHTIVHNEENFIWFALMSIVDYVDKILIYDTGSTDRTVDIIKEVIKVKGSKVIFKEVGSTDDRLFSEMRQQMIEETPSDCDWILILDGDEVWSDEAVKELVRVINKQGDKLNSVIVPFYNLIGDMYHYQDESLGQYTLLNKKGFMTIRAINRKIPGLHIEKDYSQEGYFDGKGIAIQDLDSDTLYYLNIPYFHLKVVEVKGLIK